MPNEPTTRTAVVVGATGIIGRAIAAKLAGQGGWRVIGITRSGATVPGVDEAIAVDLSDPEEARRRLAPAAGATLLFFAAYLPLSRDINQFSVRGHELLRTEPVLRTARSHLAGVHTPSLTRPAVSLYRRGFSPALADPLARSGRGGRLALPGQTEAGSAGEQPAEG